MKYYLYRHIRLDTNKPFYIGIGTKTDENHKSIRYEYKRAYVKTETKRSIFWRNVFSKSEYEVEILLESDDYEFIKQKEIEFIALYGRRDLGEGTLVNMTDGGQGTTGAVVSEETKKLRTERYLNSEYNKTFKQNLIDNRTGEVHKIIGEYTAEIIKYINSTSCTIRLNDGTILEGINYNNLKNGKIKNPNQKSIGGKGYFGIGIYKKTNTLSYTTWSSMIRRLNIDIGVICEDWYNFQNFAAWWDAFYKEEYMEGWRLDKDILIKGNKIYSPETCCFIPPSFVNVFKTAKNKKENSSTGVIKEPSGKYTVVTRINKISTYWRGYETNEEAYKKYIKIKEQSFKNKAEEWKGKVSEEVYQSLINYKIIE